MENENVVVKQKNSKGIIILFILVIVGLIGFIAYDKTINNKVDNTNNNTEVSENNATNEVNDNNQVNENKQETITYDYSKLKGVYTFEYYELDLLENGLYHYEASLYAPVGDIGNYTIVGNEIHLNQLFHHGSDAALDVQFAQKVLKINSIDEIVDETPINFETDQSVVKPITLKRNASKEIFNFENFLQQYDIFNNNRQR